MEDPGARPLHDFLAIFSTLLEFDGYATWSEQFVINRPKCEVIEALRFVERWETEPPTPYVRSK
jgi:hypothetical protein